MVATDNVKAQSHEKNGSQHGIVKTGGAILEGSTVCIVSNFGNDLYFNQYM